MIGGRILVVEDDNNHALLIQRSFEDAADEYRLKRVACQKCAATPSAHQVPVHVRLYG